MQLTLDDALQLGLEHQLAGRMDLATSLYVQIIQFEPTHAEAHHLLAVVLLLQGKRAEAVAVARRATELAPEEARYHNTHGETLRMTGADVEAERAYGVAIEQEPELVEAWLNLSKLRLAQRQLVAAEEACRRALAIEPESAMAREQLRNLLLRKEDRAAAIAQLVEATERDPDDPGAWRDLGLLLGFAHRQDQGLAALERAAELAPEEPAVLDALASAYAEHGLVDRARDTYQRSQELHERDGLKLRMATLLPVILDDTEQIQRVRSRFRAEASALISSTQVVDPITEVGSTNFLLAYHGEDDRELQQLVARMHLSACPSLAFEAPHASRPRPVGERIRVGFISRFLKSHSIGKSSRGLIAQLPRDRFHVTTVRVEPAPSDDPVARWIDERSDEVVVLPEGLAACRERLAAEELDILFYQDIGMDPLSYYLAYARLAPVQCVSFGHPVTTGIPSLDYYLSTEEFEPEGAERHYSESLVRLPTQISYYYPYPAAQELDREAFGLAEDETLYLCPQTLFKFHPTFDPILRGILRRDPRGRLLVIASQFGTWGELLAQRFLRTMPDVAKRVMFVPSLREDAFRGLVALADVVLDTPHFGGYNTSLEALAKGIPVITRPGRFQRGRHTAAFYRRMGVAGLSVDSAEAYVARAVELGTDASARRALSSTLAERSAVLFEDPTVPTTYADWFESVLRR